MADLARAATQWREDGWVLVEGLVPETDIDAAQDDIAKLYGSDTFADYNRAKGFPDGSPEGKLFRGSQFDGMRGFPFGGSGKLNDLFVHPRLCAFASAAMGSDDLRIYQAAVWGKWAGDANYEQPLHRDGNHSLVPTRMEPGFWHLEGFLYLSDVDEDFAPARLVPRSKMRDGMTDEDLYEHEITATGKRGSFLAYSSDIWHRGSDFGRDDASRFVMVVSYKLGGHEWFGYDAFPRLGQDVRFSRFLAGKGPDELSLFGIPRPGHPYWNEAMVEEMARRHAGLDMTPWREALSA